MWADETETPSVLKDLLWRAAHTFWQTFIAVFVLPDNLLDVGAWESAIVAAAAAGMSAVKTFVSAFLAYKSGQDG